MAKSPSTRQKEVSLCRPSSMSCDAHENLMLKEEVVEAVRAEHFHVWAVSHIDEGIELLMERTAGDRAAGETFPEGTVRRLVEDRLRQYAGHLRAFGNVWPGAGLTIEGPEGRNRTPHARLEGGG